ncbi:MAG: TlpA family protein disulfide reductase [Bacteroidales bacterium]|nr:TlpA family protein disulfide reductase [Bacteroidales bacterium]
MRNLVHSVSALAYILIMCVSCSPRERSVELPFIAQATSSILDITRVDLTDSVTTLHMKAYYRPGMWIKIAPETVLKSDNITYSLTGADGIEPGAETYMPDSGMIEFTLSFEPLPLTARSFDFVEGDLPDAFKLWGVDLTGKGGEGTPAGLPAGLRKLPADGPLPDPVLTAGPTTVNVHLLEFNPEFRDNWFIVCDNIDGTQEHEELKIDENGNASKTFTLAGPVHAYVVNGSIVCASGWLEAGAVNDIYVDCRNQGGLAMYHRPGIKLPNGMYSTGAYSGLNRMYSKSDSKFRIYSYEPGLFDYHASADDVVDILTEKYTAYVDSIQNSDYPEMIKEVKLYQLRNDVLDIAANYRRILKNQLCNEDQSYEYDIRKVPDDSIPARLTDEHYADITRLFDISDPKILYGGAAVVDIDWSKYGVSGDFPKGLYMVAKNIGDAKKGKLSEAVRDSLLSLSNPFFAAVCDTLVNQAIADIEHYRNSELIIPTPQVSDKEVFDAIIAPHRGKVVLVDLWNTWCTPCRTAIKASEPLKDGELKSDDIVWIYIADDSSPLAKYMEMVPEIRGHHYRLNEQQIAVLRERFNVDGIPFYILVDRSGKAVGHPDFRDHSKMKEAIFNAL